MKKTYLKPDAEYVSFYSEEDITELPGIDQYAVGEAPSGFVGSDDNDQSWS